MVILSKNTERIKFIPNSKVWMSTINLIFIKIFDLFACISTYLFILYTYTTTLQN